MSSTMEVDSKEGGSPVVQEGGISVHPLAIVNMSDQYTRITCGGTPLDCNAPVVGLLFGTYSDNTDDDAAATASEFGGTGNDTMRRSSRSNKKDGEVIEYNYQHLHIRDADDIPIDLSEVALTQVSLHQAVFAHHYVVGWYRVAQPQSNNETLEPTPQDLLLTQQLQQYYCSNKNQSNSSSEEVSPQPQQDDQKEPRRFVFGLLQVKKPVDDDDGKSKKQQYQQQEQESKDNDEDDDDDEEELPFSLYQIHAEDTTTNPVLLGLDHWKLQTSEPERIAVERVVSEQQQDASSKSNTSNNNKKSKNDNNDGTTGSDGNVGAYVSYTQNIQNSLLCMNDRVQFIIDYLIKAKQNQVPLDRSLLRQINSLALQLGPLNNNTTNNSCPPNDDIEQQSPRHNDETDAILISQLAVIAKTLHSVQSYTEKFRIMHENRPNSMTPGGGGGPGGGQKGRY